MKVVSKEVVISYPTQEVPRWSHKVNRWNQIDALAFVVLEAYWELKEHLPPPHQIILDSLHCSNETDWAFVRSNATSPTKFVHTLPNIRGASLVQVMDWQGPLTCFQSSTPEDALESAKNYHSQGITWLVTVTRQEPLLQNVSPSHYNVTFYVIS